MSPAFFEVTETHDWLCAGSSTSWCSTTFELEPLAGFERTSAVWIIMAESRRLGARMMGTVVPSAS